METEELHSFEIPQSFNIPQSLRRYISDGTKDEIVARYASLPQLAESHDFESLDRDLVVVDTEATGFSFTHDELTQIAAARVEEGRIVDWYVTFVNPGKPIPEEVAHLTNIHDADVVDAPSPNVALEGLAAFVGSSKVVAHNVSFDKTFTTKHPGGYPLLDCIWIDSLDLARIALPRLKSHRLIDLVNAFDLPRSTHRADDDVASTCAILRVLYAAIYAMPVDLVSYIANLGQRDDWQTRVVFEEIARLHTADLRTASSRTASSRTADLPTADLYTANGGEGENESESETPRFTIRALRRKNLAGKSLAERQDAEELASDPAKGILYPTPDEIDKAFSRNGLLGHIYEKFEPRQEQRQMAHAVRTAFERSSNLSVEAGTGVGKSMAYLVPAALLARKNNISVGVATKTNALLDQLVYHELPALKDALAKENPSAPPLTYAPLKGYSHYPCLLRVDRLVAAGASVKTIANKEVSQAPSLAALLSFIEQTDYDDMDSLKIDYRVLPRRTISTTSSDCLKRKCPYYGSSCFVHGQRRQAAAADIVVTNQSLLFCDVAAEGGLLPPIRYWVVDEAHNAENEARRAFSTELSAEDLLRTAARTGADETARNVFVSAERRVIIGDGEEKATLFYALLAKARAAGRDYAQAAQKYAIHMKDLAFFLPGKKSRSYDISEIWLNDDLRASETFAQMAAYAGVLSEAAGKLVTVCQELVGYLEGIDGAAQIQREIAALAMELKEQIAAIDLIIRKPDQRYAYSATVCRKSDRVAEKQEALLLNVGERLNESLFARTHSVVLTSATISVNRSFDSFERALGLNAGEDSKAHTCMLSSSYDFDTQMTIYVVSDMPEPLEPSYLSRLQRLLIDTHRAQQGSMLTLFTNRHDMEACFKEVQTALKEDDLRVVCQKWGVSVKGLRDDFLADEHLSLFALKSFWEGFDAPGATLKGVIIPKLPFAKPTDPLSCERAARDDQAWRRYVLPQAVIETKQAAGRLIRSADDEGVLILADKRLLTKSYGKAFLNSMPSKNIKVMKASDIVREIRNRQS